MAEKSDTEDIPQFSGGKKSHREHLNKLVDGTNGTAKKVKALEDKLKKYQPMILTLCDSGDIAAFEIQGMRVSDQPA